MERDYSLASVLGGAAGIAVVILLATLAIAGPRLGNIGPTDWGFGGHSPSLPNVSADDGRSHGSTASGCGGVPCAGPLSGSDGGGTFVAPDTADPGLGAHLALGDLDADGQNFFNDGRRNQGGLPEPAGAPFGSREGSAAPTLFTGGGGIPTAFLGQSAPTVTTTPPPVTSTPPTVTVPEPTVWALLLLGLGAVGAALRSRRRRATT